MHSRYTLSAVLAVSLGAAALACGSAADSLFGASGGPSAAKADAGDGVVAPAAGPTSLTENGILLVHAATAPAFRLCFGNQLKQRPQPDAKLMPNANVVGVDIGSAVRIDPLAARDGTGDIFYFSEAILRPVYGAGTAEPTCETLLGPASDFAKSAIKLPPITEDLSEGLHLLALTGCAGNSPTTTYTKAECGADYLGTSTLALHHLSLLGYTRGAAGTIPTQILQLSKALDLASNGSGVTVSFGPLADGEAPQPVATDVQYLGAPTPQNPSALDFQPKLASDYEENGFTITYPGISGPTSVKQSLATITTLSSPRELPQDFYGQSSNYIFLVLGSPTPPYPDGGGEDPDPLRHLHFIGVPVVEPKADAGPDAAPADGG